MARAAGWAHARNMHACGIAQPLEQLEEREAREEAGDEAHLNRVIGLGLGQGQDKVRGLGLRLGTRVRRPAKYSEI